MATRVALTILDVPVEVLAHILRFLYDPNPWLWDRKAKAAQRWMMIMCARVCRHFRNAAQLAGLRLDDHWFWRDATNGRDIVAKFGAWRIAYLMISRCPWMLDVDGLNGCYSVGINGCNELVDVSALGRCHTVGLSYCAKICDVSALRACRSVILLDLPRLTSVDHLGSVHYLAIHHCHSITSVDALATVHKLDIRNCRGITSIRRLGGVRTLILARLAFVVEVHTLLTCHTLQLTHCQIDMHGVSLEPKIVDDYAGLWNGAKQWTHCTNPGCSKSIRDLLQCE